jgi:hypothetical protein
MSVGNSIEWFIEKNNTNTGPIVGWKGISEIISITDHFLPIRWVEKRVAILKNLLDFNYRIKFFTPLADTEIKTFNDYDECDILVIELGFVQSHKYKTLRKVSDLVNDHEGPIFYINDDPEHWLQWKWMNERGDLIHEDWSRWTIIVNAIHTNRIAEAFPIPNKARIISTPLHTYMTLNDYCNVGNNKLIYHGGVSGRENQVRDLVRTDTLNVYNDRNNLWKSMFPEVIIHEAPKQSERMSLYRNHDGCLALYDYIHKECGWHTSRAYHALYSGIPVCGPPGNDALDWIYPVTNKEEVYEFANLPRIRKEEIWNQQKETVLSRLTKVDILKL